VPARRPEGTERTGAGGGSSRLEHEVRRGADGIEDAEDVVVAGDRITEVERTRRLPAGPFPAERVATVRRVVLEGEPRPPGIERGAAAGFRADDAPAEGTTGLARRTRGRRAADAGAAAAGVAGRAGVAVVAGRAVRRVLAARGLVAGVVGAGIRVRAGHRRAGAGPGRAHVAAGAVEPVVARRIARDVPIRCTTRRGWSRRSRRSRRSCTRCHRRRGRTRGRR